MIFSPKNRGVSLDMIDNKFTIDLTHPEGVLYFHCVISFMRKTGESYDADRLSEFYSKRFEFQKFQKQLTESINTQLDSMTEEEKEMIRHAADVVRLTSLAPDEEIH